MAFSTRIGRLRLFSSRSGNVIPRLPFRNAARLPLVVLCIVMVACVAPAIALTVGKQPVALEARLEGDRAVSVLTVTLTHKVDVDIYPMQAPDRLIIDLPAVNFQIPPAFKSARTPLVKMVRYGLLGGDRARIVIDLAAPALAGKISTQMVASGFAREFSIEIKAVEPSLFAMKAQEAEFAKRSLM